MKETLQRAHWLISQAQEPNVWTWGYSRTEQDYHWNHRRNYSRRQNGNYRCLALSSSEINDFLLKELGQKDE